MDKCQLLSQFPSQPPPPPLLVRQTNSKCSVCSFNTSHHKHKNCYKHADTINEILYHLKNPQIVNRCLTTNEQWSYKYKFVIGLIIGHII